MKRAIKILLACEESQAVCIEMRKLGHNAYSCDLLPCSGGHPEWHIQGDAVKEAYSGKYDIMIAFPPCTHIAVSGAAWFKEKRKDGRQQEGIDFFMKLIKAPIDKIAIENPVGIMSSEYMKPNQTIHPYYFGDEAQKTTHLWLKNLPQLYHNAEPNLFDSVVTHVGKGEFYISPGGKKIPKWYNQNINNKENRQKSRSVTFPGIAKAMAEQWGNL